MATITGIPELWTDNLESLGVSQKVSFHMRVQFDDGTEKWYYFGTPIPTTPSPIPYVQQPSVLFPAEFLNLPDSSMTVYSLALEVAVNKIQTGL
jgi:hypothetical protein